MANKSIQLKVRELPTEADGSLSLLYPRVELEAARQMSREERNDLSRSQECVLALMNQVSEQTTGEPVRLSEAEHEVLAGHPDWNDLIGALTLCYEARISLRDHNFEMERSNYQDIENQHLDRLRELAPQIRAAKSSNIFAETARQQVLARVEEALRVARIMEQQRPE